MNPYHSIPFFCRIPVQNFNLCWLKHLWDSRWEKKYLRGIWLFSEIDQYERKCICKKISSDFIIIIKGFIKGLLRKCKFKHVNHFHVHGERKLKPDLVAVSVRCLFLTVPWVGLLFVNVAFPDLWCIFKIVKQLQSNVSIDLHCEN